ncbi:MAG: hypothetical protein M9916_01840 [Crocinitomicaceae bacterium]|nr:hypothetical protein [Crocinitomicaceae bacterium]
MKKVLLLAGLAVFVLSTSCKKEYTCKYTTGTSATYSEKDYNEAQINALKAGCELVGGTWSSK